jgi:hypothetical protein
MHEKDVAEIAARIVIAVIHSGKLISLDEREVSAYYTAIHKTVMQCDNEQKSSSSEPLSTIQQ